MLALCRSSTTLNRRPALNIKYIYVPVTLMSQLCDCDANLFHSDLSLLECIQSAAAVNVKWFVVPGSTMEDSIQALSLAREMPNVIASAGIHPYHVTKHTLDIKTTLLDLLSSNECSSVVLSCLFVYCDLIVF